MIKPSLDHKILDFIAPCDYPDSMSENKDQKLASVVGQNGQTVPVDSDTMNVDEIDKAIAAEDPNFLNEIGGIKLTGGGADLSVMGEAFQVLAESEITLKDRLVVLFQYSQRPKQFVLFWSTFLGVLSLLFITWKVQKNFLDQKLFMNSFADLGGEVRDYNPLTETEAFYDNPKFSKNIMTLSKMFINLKTSENSGPAPMLALELNVEGLSSDAIVEIKDREAEFKDLLLRYSEEKNYDELVTTKGKQELCDQFRQIINSHLTRGQVRKVLLNSFIIKP